MVDSPPEKSAGQTTGDQTLLEGDGRLNRHGQRGGKGKKERGNGQTSLGKEPGGILEGGEGGGGTRTITGRENSKLNLEGQSLEIDQAAVRGLEHHHPIMNKLGGLGDRSNRQTDSDTH